MLKKLKMKFMGFMAAAMLVAGTCSMQTYAFMEDASYVSIDSGVVDRVTYNGVTVEAMYRSYYNGYGSDTTYSCAAFVKRFYSQVFGRNVYNLNDIYSTPCVDSGSFYKTDTPKVGDIVRDNESVHWAIVKEVNSDGRVTVIQQNAWDKTYTKAMVNAKIRLNDSRYTFFRWSGNEGNSASVSVNYSIEYGDKNISETNAVLYAKVINPSGRTVTQVGCYFWNSKGDLLKRYVESCSRSEVQFNMWYDVQAELGLTLTSDTTYKYQFFVIDNGTEYKGEVQTFTTSGKSAKATDGQRSSDDSINLGLNMMEELFGFKSEWLIDEVGDPETVKNNVYYYNITTLYEKTGTMACYMNSSNQVNKVTWTYTYGNGCEENLKNSETFYKDIVRVAKEQLGGSFSGYCTNPSNMTSEWKNVMKIERNIVDNIPVICVTLTGSWIS